MLTTSTELYVETPKYSKAGNTFLSLHVNSHAICYHFNVKYALNGKIPVQAAVLPIRKKIYGKCKCIYVGWIREINQSREQLSEYINSLIEKDIKHKLLTFKIQFLGMY